ncbi:MAG: nitric oxide reductase activation protein NorD, partial [Firmicutes bacterium]|nr:nitric oxide reductase activation protein NorD [Bacillota bacterium]
MGVSHKKVRQLIEQKKKTITDRQFFVSRILAGHFADMAAVQTKRYGYSRRIKLRIVWEPKNPNLACTENEFIWINAGHSFVTKKRSRQDRYDVVCGLFAHELGHILYTDFLASQTQLNKFEAGYWYPEKPLLRNADERRHEADIWDYIKKDPKYMNAMLSVFHQVRNILEDGYIEGKMLSRYPGVLGYGLAALRDTLFENTPTLTQMIESESSGSHIWLSITSLMLSYAKWGELKYGDEPLSDERVQLIFSLLGEIDNAISNSSFKERLVSVNTIIVRCWPYIKDFLDLCEQQAQNATQSGAATSASDIVSQLMSELSGASREAAGDTAPVQEPSGGQTQPAAASKRAATAQQAAESSGAQEQEGSVESPGSPDSTEPEDETPAADPLSDISADTGKSEKQSAQEVSAEETGRIPLTQTDRLSEPVGGETADDNAYAGAGYDRAAKDIERILDNMAETAVHTELESARTAELNELANGISYGDIHSGVPKTVHRITELPEDLIEQYKEASPPLLYISKQLQQSITQQLQDKRRGGKQTGLLIGRRLDTHALPRNDGHVFYKNALPSDAPQLAVGLVLDESGSM